MYILEQALGGIPLDLGMVVKRSLLNFLVHVYAQGWPMIIYIHKCTCMYNVMQILYRYL